MKKSKLIVLAFVTALWLSGCTERDTLNQGSNSTNQTQGTQSSNTTESTSPEPLSEPTASTTEFRILEGPISDLGLTVEQLTEKRGKLKVSTYKGTQFENGIGTYGWKTTKSDSLTDGGCNMIFGLKPTELFSGITYPVTLDILSDIYGFVPITVEKEKGLDDCYWASFSHPQYEGVSFIFGSTEYGVIEENTGCYLSLNVDSTEAKPVVQSSISH